VEHGRRKYTARDRIAQSMAQPAHPRSRWKAWTRLSRSDRQLFVEAALLIPVLAVSLRVFDVQRTLRWIEGAFRPRRRTSDEDEAIVDRAVRALRRTRRHAPYAGRCLPRALALKWMLGRRGVESALRFGARMEQGRFSAHAWVERHGVVLEDFPQLTARFKPFVGPFAGADATGIPPRQSSPPSPRA
jgi:hypothetical protein